MIVKIHEKFTVICDGCEDALEKRTDTYPEAMDRALAAGWSHTLVEDDEAVHFCVACQ